EASTFLAAHTGIRLDYKRVSKLFGRVRQSAEIRREATARYQPRIHDIRHSAAVHRVIAWYRAGADVQKLVPQFDPQPPSQLSGYVAFVAAVREPSAKKANRSPDDRRSLAVSASFIPGISGEGAWLQRRYAQSTSRRDPLTREVHRYAQPGTCSLVHRNPCGSVQEDAKIQSHLPRQTGNRCALESPRSANATGGAEITHCYCSSTTPAHAWRK